jgi:hypothetical protein
MKRFIDFFKRKKKVFCGECKFYKKRGEFGRSCFCKTKIDTWEERQKEIYKYAKPNKQNKNNDCKDFTLKEK